MSITTKQGLIDFSLRQLGGGVVNIEVTPEQCQDVVEVALEFFQEFYFDGIEKDYLAHVVTASVITVASTTGLTVGQTLTNATTGTTAVIRALTATTITIERMKGFTKFVATNVLTNGTINVTVVSIALGDVDNGFFAVEDDIVGVTRILPPQTMFNSSDMLFNPQYQIMAQEVYNMTSSGGLQYYYSVMSYLGHMDFILRKEMDFRFNRRWNKLYIDVGWGNDIKINDIVVIECFRYVNPEVYGEVYNDRWLKDYTTALLKKQWGMNLSKYSGMTLPGGITYNGKQLYDDAIQEIDKIQDQVMNMSAPLGFSVG